DLAADEFASRLATWEPPDNAVAAHELSDALLAAGQPDAAERVLVEGAANATDPRAASLMSTHLGNLRNGQGDQLGALAAWREAVTLWRDNGEARVRLGEALLLSGDADGAAKELAMAVALSPDHFWARRYLGQAYMQLNQPRLAAQEFAAAASIDPTVADTYLLLGDARAGDGDRKAATEGYRRVLELAPDSPLAGQAQARLDQLGQR
ncbi:MAG: tetratricopeptide repeat protein, partial [Caldilineaceae bacterium]|nr:tetratricopeptide repeat protein [Caldilineaceae bacterium]